MSEADNRMEELADRVERASGADRELDAAIYYDVLGFCRHARTERSGAQSDTGFDCLDCGADSWGNLGSKGQRLHDAAPLYTESLDAAMSLVPDDCYSIDFCGFQCDVSTGDDAPEMAKMWSCTVTGAGIPFHKAIALTRAAALTAACLRARARSAGPRL